MPLDDSVPRPKRKKVKGVFQAVCNQVFVQDFLLSGLSSPPTPQNFQVIFFYTQLSSFQPFATP